MCVCVCLQLMHPDARLVEVYLQGVYSRISSLQPTCDDSHMHTGVVCANYGVGCVCVCVCVGEGGGGRGCTRSGRLRRGGRGQWLPWTQQQREEHLRAEPLLRRGKSPSARRRGSRSLSPQTRRRRGGKKKKKTFSSSVPGIVPRASPPPSVRKLAPVADRNTPASPRAFLTFHTGEKGFNRVLVEEWGGGGGQQELSIVYQPAETSSSPAGDRLT